MRNRTILTLTLTVAMGACAPAADTDLGEEPCDTCDLAEFPPLGAEELTLTSCSLSGTILTCTQPEKLDVLDSGQDDISVYVTVLVSPLAASNSVDLVYNPVATFDLGELNWEPGSEFQIVVSGYTTFWSGRQGTGVGYETQVSVNGEYEVDVEAPFSIWSVGIASANAIDLYSTGLKIILPSKDTTAEIRKSINMRKGPAVLKLPVAHGKSATINGSAIEAPGYYVIEADDGPLRPLTDADRGF